jgi:pilus assembly protein CpaE
MSQTIRVVVIGSDTDSTNNIVERVKKEGNNATVEGVAVGFERGAELIHKRKPMVVILDMCTAGIIPCLRWIETLLHKSPQTAIYVVCEDNSYETVRNFMRVGAAEYLLKPVSDIDLSSAFQKFRRSRVLPKTSDAEGGKIYSVFSSKNGVGVTTIAVNLAANIHKITKEPTIIVDLDLVGGDVTTFLNMKPPYTITDITRNIGRANTSLIHGIITKHESGIYVLAEPHHVEEGVLISGEAVRRVLSLLRTRYKHIVIDTESNLTQTTMAALDMSDLILLTFVQSLPGIKNTERYLNYLAKDGIRSNKIRLIVNRYLKKFEVTIEQAEKLLQQPVFWQIPNDFNTAMSCLNKGIVLEAYAPGSKLNLSIKDLAMTIAGKVKPPKTKTSPFNRLFRTSV